MSFAFGGKAGAAAGTGGFEHYIKTFRERTEVTFLIGDPEEFFSYREHFDNGTLMPGAKKSGISYGCATAEGAERCIGCDFPVEHPEWTDEWLRSEAGKAMFTKDNGRRNRAKADPGWGVRDSSGKWVFPVIEQREDKLYVALYKVGWTFFSEQLKAVHENVGSLLGQRFVVVTSTTNFGGQTPSALIPTGKAAWETDRDVPTQQYIGEQLGKKYLEVFKVYVEKGLTNEDGTPTGFQPSRETGEGDYSPPVGAGQAPTEEYTAPPATGKDEGKDVSEAGKYGSLPAGLEGLDIPEGWDPMMNAKTASPTALKEWLDNDPRGAVEYPPRAARPVLISLVEKAQLPF